MQFIDVYFFILVFQYLFNVNLLPFCPIVEILGEVEFDIFL